MRYRLFDYQREAAIGCLERLRWASRDLQEDRRRSAFALSAITGAGKTVIATAVIEAILHGSSDLGVDADPRATFLWVTDDPALNRQTRHKMLAGSDLLRPARLVVLDNDFLNSTLSVGRVYFLNIQKLSKTSGLSQGGRNLRQYSMWEVLANTINGANTDLYLVLDEAHRGMKTASDRQTIVQRLIAGEQGSNPPMPIVWGISATIRRFETAMQDVTDRTRYQSVEVDIDKVRASGLVKDEIGIDEPDEKGTFGTTLLREAVKATLDYERRWATYSEEQDEEEVWPILVVQVPDKASEAKLTELVEVIESEWPELGPDAIAHVFGEHDRLYLGGRAVDWVPPESIQSDTEIRVVLAKQAISTGWDCPRAEVLYSERPAKDVTYIAQIIGRMVRSPLTHRVSTDDALNSVACFLPLFDRTALDSIKAELEGAGRSNGDLRVGSAVVRAPRLFMRNPSIDSAAFDLVCGLPSLPAPDLLANPLRRAKELARLLTDTARGGALMPGAGAQLTDALMAKLDGLAAQHFDRVDDNVLDLETADIRQTKVSVVGELLDVTKHQFATHVADMERDTRKIVKGIREGVGKDYFAHLVRKHPDDDPFGLRVKAAGLLMIEDVSEELESEATKWVQARQSEFSVAIKNTTGSERDAYRRVEQQASTPERVTIDLRDNMSAPTKNSKGDDLPTYKGHLYSDESGLFPAELNSWETKIIKREIEESTLVAWYRNPSRASSAALRIAYMSDEENWTSLQPDFLVVSRRTDGSLGASIIDPHSFHLADALAKLKALAEYAEQYGDEYVRIESLAENSEGQLVVLDLQSPTVRETVSSFRGGEISAIYDSDVAQPYF
ncbi:DEAD/DEAH box helicase [Candidatus Poriferisocius sp.]|uniref:DEAD/DEAH box helicase n=1 Tax=Candidatus Poriferisocius sp. TaxID=3101276 RepID=UPI003B5243C5